MFNYELFLFFKLLIRLIEITLICERGRPLGSIHDKQEANTIRRHSVINKSPLSSLSHSVI